jgi:5-methylcytosine-specific restriction endonuclease McrA
MAVRPCLDCGRRTERGSRCARCERARFPTSPGRMRGRAWMKRRDEVLRAFAFKCASCGAIERPLEIHHVDGDHRNNAFSNLRPLCRPCHAKAGMRLI